VTQSNLRRDHIAAASLACPTLVIAAAEDPLRPAEETQELADAIPNATLMTIEGSGHMLPLEQPEALGSAIKQWLSSLEGLS
jgi:pimeloyl-ACP methyl ester carboxylesterase